MKYCLPFILLASAIASAQTGGQLQRYDSFAATITSASGIGNLAQVIPNATITVFNQPAIGVSCAGGGCVAASTFTSRAPSTLCGAGVPLTRPTANVCIGTADSSGNFGFWAASGAYQYCVAATNITTQCYNVLLGATNSIVYADQFAGGDCGAKINAADAALGTSAGLIYVNLPTCGTAWTTLVSVGGNGSGHVLKFIGGPAPLSFSTSAGISIDGGNSGMDGLTTAVNNVSITAANGSNIPWVVRMNAGGAGLSNLKVDGNFANNPTGGVGVLVTNSAAQPIMFNVTVTGAPGYAIYSNTNAGLGAGSFDGHLDNVHVTSNQGGGLLLRNTNDWMVQHSPIDVNGAIGTVNTTNSAVSTCPSNCVTQQTGGKWTTDTSMIGVKIAIGANAAGTHPTYYTVTNIYSTTLLQVSPAPGTQTGSAFGLGAAVELSDSPGFRLIHADVGLAGSCGIWMYGTVGNKSSNNEIIGPANQFGNTNNDDICIFGYDTVGGNYEGGSYTTIQGNNFTGLGVCNANLAACNNKWDHVWVDDPPTGLQIVGNNFNSQTGAFTNRAGIETTENLAGEGTKGRPIYNAGNYFGDSQGSNWTYGGAYGTAKIVSNIAQGSSGSVTWTNGEAGSLLAAYGICDEAVNTNPCKWWNVAGGVLQLLNNVGTPIWAISDAGLATKYGALTATGNGLNSVQASSGAITIGSGTSIAATSLCSTTQCPAGRYRIDAYIDITTACTTTGTYTPWLAWTDDQGAKTGSSTTTYFPAAGLGVTPATNAAGPILDLSATTHYLAGSMVLTTTGAATGGLGSINYGTTAGACGTGGPMVGKMYFDVTRLE